MPRLIIAMVALCGLLALPAAAHAQDNSAEDEYTEHVPGGGGDKPSDNPGGGHGNGDALPPGSEQDLQELGADGEAAANLAQATAPKGRGAGEQDASDKESSDAQGGGSAAGGSEGDGGLSVDDGNPVVDVLNVASGDDGMGIVLPLILGLSLLAGIGFLLSRRRGGSEAGPA